MSQTNPTPIDALPTAPSTSSPSTFAALADAFVAALSTLRSQINTIATQTYNNAVDAYNNAVSATDSAAAAAAAAASAVAAAGATAWVSGATYAQGAVVWSLIDFLPYRRAIAGSGTTDPSADSVNWVVQVAGDPQWTTITADPLPAVAGTFYRPDTSGGTFSFTMPATPANNDRIGIAGNFATNKLTIDWNGAGHFGLTDVADPTTDITDDNTVIVLTYFVDEWGFGV